MRGSCIIGQSGGPTSVINASLCGVIKACRKSKHIKNIYGALNGLEGIINEDIIDFKYESRKDINNLLYTPSAALGSVRFQLGNDFDKDATYKKILDVFKKYNILYFYYIGGNDSMDTCYKLDKYFNYVGYPCMVVGIPKTIDNDLMYTDHSPGYASSCRYISTVISEIYLDTQAYKTGRVSVIEIMGRDAGWLTAASIIPSLSGYNVDLIYVPEVDFDLEDFLVKVKKIYDEKRKVIVVVSEGIKDKDGEYILNKRNYNNNDTFGHLQLGGVSTVLCEHITNTYNIPVRAIELNLPQRCASHLASFVDIKEAYNCGKMGVYYSTKGISGIMVCIERRNKKYIYTYQDLGLIKSFVKSLPNEFINDTKDGITNKYLDYVLPLISKTKMKYHNGMPIFSNLKKIKVKKEV